MKNHGFLIGMIGGLIGMLLLGASPASALTMSGPSNSAYHIIIDYTQSDNLNALVTNTQDTTTKSFPLNGTEMPPVVAVNPTLYPGTYSQPSPDLYVEADTYNTDILDPGLVNATDNTCDQGVPSQCPTGNVPVTFVHRLGTYDSSTKIVTPLGNTKLSTGQEQIESLFDLNDQAFDMDRIRYAANRLWYQWYSEVTNASGYWYTHFYQKLHYQPTGTMSFETFVDNLANGRTMYGIVRVVVPTDGNGTVYLDPSQPVNGAEFSAPGKNYCWKHGIISGNELSALVRAWSKAVYKNANPWTTINIDGTVLFDYVSWQSYHPNEFLDGKQDYVDRYTSVSDHDADAATSQDNENVILTRSQDGNSNMQDDEQLNINPVWVGTDNRVDSADQARTYMIKNVSKTTGGGYASSYVSDDDVWEYWMRQAVTYPVGNSTRTAIINDLTGPNSQYNYATQTFNAGATRRTDYDNNVWPALAEKDQFHAYFPSGYEHGWIVAFDALHMGDLDATTTETTAGSWWKHLPDDATVQDPNHTGLSITVGGDQHSGRSSKGAYPEFGVPNASEAISVDADGDGTLTKMPNFFSTGWEDLPAFAFAGGLLDVHAFANISGMMYTPDSCEIESNGDHSANESGAQEYISAAIVAGNGIWLGGATDQNAMIAISYNYNSFDRLRHENMLTVKNISDMITMQGM